MIEIAGCLVTFFGHNLCKLNDGTHLTLYRQGNNDAVSYRPAFCQALYRLTACAN